MAISSCRLVGALLLAVAGAAIAVVAAASDEPPPPTPSVPTVFTPTTPFPTPYPPEPCQCCDLCNIVPPFLAVAAATAPPSPPPPQVSSSSPPSSSPVVDDCSTAMAVLAPCSRFLAGHTVPSPTPQSGCCNGLSAFLAAGAGAGAEGRLRCLCPILHGEAVKVNLALPEPVDLVRMVYLPVACGLALPPETISLCYGQNMPTMANFTSAGSEQGGDLH